MSVYYSFTVAEGCNNCSLYIWKILPRHCSEYCPICWTRCNVFQRHHVDHGPYSDRNDKGFAVSKGDGTWQRSLGFYIRVPISYHNDDVPGILSVAVISDECLVLLKKQALCQHLVYIIATTKLLTNR